MNDYNFIRVTLNDDKKLEIQNPTDLPLIGKGHQGAVFKIDNNRCIKVYPCEEVAEEERSAYLRTIGSPMMPLLYESGPKYIIIEYINGSNLKDYLLEKGRMPRHITQELINMFNEMKRLGFLRRDESLRHILVKDKKKLKS